MGNPNSVTYLLNSHHLSLMFGKSQILILKLMKNRSENMNNGYTQLRKQSPGGVL